VLEFDGYTYHKYEEQFVHDRKRDRVLQENGFTVQRFASKEFAKGNYVATSMELGRCIERLCESWGQTTTE